jgi:hypothetical protein
VLLLAFQLESVGRGFPCIAGPVHPDVLLQLSVCPRVFACRLIPLRGFKCRSFFASAIFAWNSIMNGGKHQALAAICKDSLVKPIGEVVMVMHVRNYLRSSFKLL